MKHALVVLGTIAATSLCLAGPTAAAGPITAAPPAWTSSVQDQDGDGVADADDAFPLDPTETTDTDTDGTGNNADPDDDNDGKPDVRDTDSSRDCLDGGWREFTNPSFRNQGECVGHHDRRRR